MKITEHLYRFEDTCNVYAILDGDEAVLVDFGDGSVLSRLEALGVRRVSDVLMTHHHRDQGQGLALAAGAGARVWAPHAEQELFRDVEAHWQAREIYNNYNVRQDRFSLLEPVPVAGTLHDYGVYRFGAITVTVIPTPGHTPGSISFLTEIDSQRVVFSGDLIAAPGKVWSLAATQWSYNGAEGAAASVASLLDLKDLDPDVLLPSHGEPVCEPGPAIDLLAARLGQLLEHRDENPRLFSLHQQPYEAITPHLLLNRTSLSNSYVLLSESGKALLIDFGYDFMTGMAPGSDRASRRPWLHTLPALKRAFGVRKIDVVLPTHYHDDHVAGFNLLRAVEGTQVWAPENFAPILEHPERYDLPCLWYDPVPVDRVIPLEEPVPWEEYQFVFYALPGHTRYAAAIAFTVDGQRVLAAGDQYQDGDGLRWNYVYQNRFESGDYRSSAALYARLAPDLILPGHWEPQWTPPGYLDQLGERGALLERLHEQLLPVEISGLGAEGVAARLQPYQLVAYGGRPVALEVEIRNPFPYEEEAVVRPAVPAGWQAEEGEVRLRLAPCSTGRTTFHVTPPHGLAARRARVAVDLTVGSRRLGQQAEALVTVVSDQDLGRRD
jgi:glyoxylase-like metal-dependent hydrolase (beta-lactamase superfamily II)